METYAEVLRKKTMNEQKRKEKWPQTVSIKEKPDAAVTIELPDNIILKASYIGPKDREGKKNFA